MLDVLLAEPTVVIAGDTIALARGRLGAVLNRQTLEIAALELPTSVEGSRALAATVAELSEDAGSQPLPTAQTRPISPAFLPLLDRTKKGWLGRLTINVSNACNLWCSYCYADHGTYHASSSLMKPEMALDVVARCLEFYDRVDTIQFFGGEPLLNPKAIHAVCLFMKRALGRHPPEFVATTNGTLSSRAIKRILREHDIGLTISLDGPRAIHDQLRPGKDGASSHDVIMRNIDTFRDIGVAIDFECTYTMAHYNAGITVCDLLDYFWLEHGKADPHISWSYLPKPDPRAARVHAADGIFREDFAYQAQQHIPVDLATDLFRQAARKSMENIVRGEGAALGFVLGVVRRLSEREAATGYCPAFHSQLSVAANGAVFPCFMFIGDSSMRMGNILSDAFPSTEVHEVWERYAGEFGPNPTGTQSWYAPLLSGCVAGDYITSGGLGDRTYEPVQHAMIEEVVLGLAHADTRLMEVS